MDIDDRRAADSATDRLIGAAAETAPAAFDPTVQGDAPSRPPPAYNMAAANTGGGGFGTANSLQVPESEKKLMFHVGVAQWKGVGELRERSKGRERPSTFRFCSMPSCFEVYPLVVYDRFFRKKARSRIAVVLK